METSLRVLGQEHPSTLTSMNNLAQTWKSQCQDSKAIELMTSCADLRVKVLGIEHPNTQDSFGILNTWRILEPASDLQLSELQSSHSNTKKAALGSDRSSEASLEDAGQQQLFQMAKGQ